jgi:hypothetical protein
MASPYVAGSGPRGTKIGLIIGGACLVAGLLATVLVLSLRSGHGGSGVTTSPAAGSSTGVGGSPSASGSASPSLGVGPHDVIAADTAGGWSRDSAGEHQFELGRRPDAQDAPGPRVREVGQCLKQPVREAAGA